MPCIDRARPKTKETKGKEKLRETETTEKRKNMTDSNQDDNLTLQRDELEALSAIYGDDFTLEEEDPPTFSVAISSLRTEEGASSREVGRDASLMVTFETDYPTKAPPIFQLSMPWIRGAQKLEIIAELEQLYLDHIGESVVYLWIERLREMLDKELIATTSTTSVEASKSTPRLHQNLEISSSALQLGESHSQLLGETGVASHHLGAQSQCSTTKKLTIFTGEPFTDRKSTFQAHLTSLHDPAMVRAVLQELYTNKKIATATHNMFAYRIWNEETNSFVQDCDDDGETHAGSRLLHLLQILDARNVMVVVTRWFGGIQLHGDRFKHINNVARQLLEQQGFIQAKLSKK